MGWVGFLRLGSQKESANFFPGPGLVFGHTDVFLPRTWRPFSFFFVFFSFLGLELCFALTGQKRYIYIYIFGGVLIPA